MAQTVEAVEASLNGHVELNGKTNGVLPVNVDWQEGVALQLSRQLSWRQERAAHVDWMARFRQHLLEQDAHTPSRQREYLLYGFRIGMKQPTKFLSK